MQEQVIVFQGDSITDCGRSREPAVFNNGLGSGYVALIAAELLYKKTENNIKVYNRGISGNRVVDLYARWKIDMINLNPAILSILIGVNDTWHEFGSKNGVEVERFEQFYRMLLDWTRKALPECKIVLCEPFVLSCGVVTSDWIAEMSERTTIVRKLAKDYSTILVPCQIDFNNALKHAPAEYWASDGVHPSLAGHAMMKESWLKATAAII